MPLPFWLKEPPYHLDIIWVGDSFSTDLRLKEAKTHGVYRLEGKTYIVQDGDIMHILAST